MFCSKSYIGCLWLVPWDPIYTPFTLEEMLDLALARERTDKALIEIRTPANWAHPEDPLNRVQHYNFWDVLQESLSLRILVSNRGRIEDDRLVAEFVDFVARSIDQVSNSTMRLPAFDFSVTCAARIHRVILNIKTGDLIPDFPYASKRSKSRHAGFETLTPLLQETLDLISRVEILLRRCHPGFVFPDGPEVDSAAASAPGSGLAGHGYFTQPRPGTDVHLSLSANI